MMNLNLAPIDEAYLKEKVEEGYYVNLAQAIRDAIRRMRESDERSSPNLYNAIMKGERQIANGQYQEYTPELRKEIQRNAQLKAQQGLKPKPEVIPHDV
jgi:putative addiction module CopG family antidote